MGNSALSVSYKETGVPPVRSGVTPQSPEEIAKRISKRSKVNGIYGPVTLLSIVDRRLDPIAHHVHTLIAACSWDKPFSAAVGEIAEALGYSERNTLRKIQTLEKLGYIAVKRRHNKKNEYTLVANEAFGLDQTPNRKHPSLRLCSKCTVNLTTNQKTGWCRDCNKNAREDRRRSGIAATERAKIAV